MPKRYEVTRKYIVEIPDEGTTEYNRLVATMRAEEEEPYCIEKIVEYLVFSCDVGDWSEYAEETDFVMEELT